ncbi:MAG TPA: lactonase family protein [Candidatus Binatia bacterium]|nr:lactonase family protein [Candidatus Binatia bacterium]
MSAEVPAAKHPTLVYIGTYTEGKSRGIYAARFDTAAGTLSTPELAAETKNPTFLALHPNGRWLYAVGEINNFGGTRAGAVSGFSIEQKTGKLTLLNQQQSGGGGPCHVAVDRTGKCVLVANYGSGSVAALPLKADGKLGEPSTTIQHQGSSVNPQRQAGPHAHFITPDPANRFALACDLGLDKVLLYRLDAVRGGLTPNAPPWAKVKPGSGPRHLAFHPNGRWVYLINEIASTLAVLAYDAEQGAMQELQTLSTLPDDFKGENICAEVQVHPSGKFVYGSNRGHDSITVFAVNSKTGKLSFVERQSTQGKTPRHFALDPSGRWLLAENQDSNTIVVFRVDAKTGRLTATGQKMEVGAPVCVVFVPER